MRTAQKRPLFGSKRTSFSKESSFTEGAKHIATAAISLLCLDAADPEEKAAVDLTLIPRILSRGGSGQLSTIG
jgi:hypothetical protein